MTFPSNPRPGRLTCTISQLLMIDDQLGPLHLCPKTPDVKPSETKSEHFCRQTCLAAAPSFRSAKLAHAVLASVRYSNSAVCQNAHDDFFSPGFPQNPRGFADRRTR